MGSGQGWGAAEGPNMLPQGSAPILHRCFGEYAASHQNPAHFGGSEVVEMKANDGESQLGFVLPAECAGIHASTEEGGSVLECGLDDLASWSPYVDRITDHLPEEHARCLPVAAQVLNNLSAQPVQSFHETIVASRCPGNALAQSCNNLVDDGRVEGLLGREVVVKGSLPDSCVFCHVPQCRSGVALRGKPLPGDGEQ